jgi:hypothetical protein
MINISNYLILKVLKLTLPQQKLLMALNESRACSVLQWMRVKFEKDQTILSIKFIEKRLVSLQFCSK